DAPSNTLLLLWSLGPDRGALLRTIAEQQESWADSLQFLTINSLDRAAQVETFLPSLPCDFPTYQVTDKTCVALGCHAALPIGWLLAPDGTLLRQRMHAREIMDYLGLSLFGS
ncbi:MAG: hypothetical protein KDC54_19450, partial [Lewinella sp.]|nr:hypothetical protein [Lewinella sp.]